jgi:F-type H+-transporting ATPase subunit gamma
MPSIKDLRRRLKSVKNTKLITKAMRSVSASKMRKAQDRRHKAKPYADHLKALVTRVVSGAGLEGQPLAESREVQKRLVVMYSSDRGLCGAFNNSINRYCQDYLASCSEQTDLYIVGKRANDYFKKRNVTIIKAHVDFLGNIDIPRILEIAKEIRATFETGDYDEIVLIHNSAVSAINYLPRRELLLPLTGDDLVTEDKDGSSATKSEYIFEPEAAAVLSKLLPKYVENKILYAFLDTFTAEHQARMIAMSNANENCEELITGLTLDMNKARQTMITNEILEIVSGADALKG